MMNVKKYRATTTRQALEQIRQDLGEDAFVLETKQVRTGGFLGFKGETQIEISAAVPGIAARPAAKKQAAATPAPAPAAAAFPRTKILNLTDDTPAAPKQTSGNDEKESILSALNSRAALSNNFEYAVSAAPKTTANNVVAAGAIKPQEIEAVEITSEAPRFVHPKKETVKTPVVEQSLPAVETSENSPAVISSREFELLRAELREVKFSLGAFANRQNIPVWDSSVSLEDFGEVFDSPFYDSYIELTATGMSPEMARHIITKIIPHYKSGFIKAEELSRQALIQALSIRIKFEPNPLEQEKPAVMAVIGSTGVGKTTTIAKLAARVALHERRRVELVTLDTYRIAAVEQLKTYAEIIGAGCQVVRSVFELDAVLRRMPADATVLIDTTGRNPHDLADQYELSDYLEQHPEIRKCLAVQAGIHPLDALAAIKKFEMYGADSLVLTKLDETTRPGAAIELVAESGLPLAYLCMGQRVPEDLQAATAESFAAQILRA